MGKCPAGVDCRRLRTGAVGQVMGTWVWRGGRAGETFGRLGPTDGARSRRCWGSRSGSHSPEKASPRWALRSSVFRAPAWRGSLRRRWRTEPGKEGGSRLPPGHGLWDQRPCFSDFGPQMTIALNLAPWGVPPAPAAVCCPRLSSQLCRFAPGTVAQGGCPHSTCGRKPGRAVSEPHRVENPPNLHGKPAS